MDFAKKQLEKYGWTEGQGLGKSNDGISVPLKPKLKFDAAGIGHDHGKELVNDWWNDVYRNALDNVEVNNQENGEVQLGLKEESIDISTKGYLKQLKKNNVTLEYGSFVKTSKLTAAGTIQYNVPDMNEENEKPKVKVLTDEELFVACAGRTAHKGARHGLKLSGKLDRLAKQEQILLRKLQNVSISDEKISIEKKMKKLVKHKEKVVNNTEDTVNLLNFDDDTRGGSSTKKKYKKKERKSVSFNETVTVKEYLPPDLDSSLLSSDSNENSIVCFGANEPCRTGEMSGSKVNDQNSNDEGIEQDLEVINDTDSNQRSFEEARYVEEKLSKAEHRLKKKNRATHRFLRNLQLEPSSHVLTADPQVIDTSVLCAKRKLTDGENTTDVKRICESLSEVKGTSIKKRKKKLKEKRHRKKQWEKRSLINSITKSLDTLCYISSDS